MNLFNIIAEIEKADPEVYGKISERRAAIKISPALVQR